MDERDQNASLKRRLSMARRVIKAQSNLIEEFAGDGPVTLEDCFPELCEEYKEAWRQYRGISGPLADH